MAKTRAFFALTGRAINEVLSFFVFSILDVLDFVLCYAYRVADFLIEAEWKPCYCSPAKEAVMGGGKILVSERSESKVVLLTSSSKLQLEEISDTLYARPSCVAEVSKCTERKRGRGRSVFAVNAAVVEMLQGKIGGQKFSPIPRWSDCDCEICNSWASSCKETLFVHADGPKGKEELTSRSCWLNSVDSVPVQFSSI